MPWAGEPEELPPLELLLELPLLLLELLEPPELLDELLLELPPLELDELELLLSLLLPQALSAQAATPMSITLRIETSQARTKFFVGDHFQRVAERNPGSVKPSFCLPSL